jgi:hypothetical protein
MAIDKANGHHVEEVVDLYILKEEDIEFASLEMSFVRLTTEPRSSIGTMYNICTDPSDRKIVV